jgi:alpha-1,3-mannosyltransferase
VNIIHIVRQFRPSVGGLEDYVENLAREQLAAGHQVLVITLDTDFQTGETLPARASYAGVDVQRVSWRFSQRYSLCRLDMATLNAVDLVHVHAIDFFVDYLSAMKRLGTLTAPLVVSTHGGFFHTEKNQRLKQLFFRTVTRATLARADAVLSCSTNDQALFSTISKQAQLINNGIRLQKFGALEAAEQGDDIVYLGRFSSNKRMQWLVEAYAALRNPRGQLKIIGRSKTGDTATLAALIQRLGCADRVQLILDVSDEVIARHLSTARFTVSASEYEGFGLGVVELMSYGLVPLLSSAPPSFNDFVRDSRSGQLFDYRFEDFERAYEALIAQWRPAAAQGALRYAEQFSWVSVAQDIQAVYEQVLARTARLGKGRAA